PVRRDRRTAAPRYQPRGAPSKRLVLIVDLLPEHDRVGTPTDVARRSHHYFCPMKKTRARLLAGGLLLLAASVVAAGPVRIVTTPDVLDDYRRLYAHADPLAVDYEVPGQRRDVVELL